MGRALLNKAVRAIGACLFATDGWQAHARNCGAAVEIEAIATLSTDYCLPFDDRNLFHDR